MRASLLLASALVLAASACAKHHTLDVGTPDAAVDASVDAGEIPIDCSTVGCSPAPICGQACESPCGCCPCSGDIVRDGVTYVCATGGCYLADVPLPASCAASTDCPDGFACCYPCGIPGCELRCTPACSSSDPSCAGGCPAVP